MSPYSKATWKTKALRTYCLVTLCWSTGYHEKIELRFSEGILLFCSMGETLSGDLQKMLQRSLSSSVRKTFPVPTYGCAYRKGGLVSLKYLFIPWTTEKVTSHFSLIICEDTVATYNFYNITSHNLRKNAVRIQKHFFFKFFKMFGSSSSGMLFPCWQKLLPWQGWVSTHACIIPRKVRRQLSDCLSGTHGLGSQPSCVKGWGGRSITVLGTIWEMHRLISLRL